MSYEYSDTNSSYDKLERQQGKYHKKTNYTNNDEFDLSMIPDSYIGNEDLWDDISDELEELYG